MIIQSLKLARVSLRCHKPFKTATVTSDLCRTLAICLTTSSGLCGWGEAVPKPMLTGDNLEGAISAARDLLWPAVKGKNAWSIADIHSSMDRMTIGYPSVKAAFDMALYSIMSQSAGLPLHVFLGGDANNCAIDTNYSIGLCTPQETGEEAKKIIADGFKSIKIKVGLDPDDDIARVRSVREAAPGASIRIDANEGWSFTQALYALKRMEPYNIELAEQPISHHELENMAELRRRCNVPIYADESCKTPVDVLRIIRLGASDGINIKLMKSGGLYPALQMIHIAKTAGLNLMIGGMVGESSLSVSAATALACAHNFNATDLDADLLLKDKLFPNCSLQYKNSQRLVSPVAKGFGLGEMDNAFIEPIGEY
ncbi:MAG: dipeptide epimerase [bacterium]|nr:dipeptide epimerase [bacterium]